MASAVHIIGAGLAGMAAAASLRNKGFAGEIFLYEAAKHIGGRCYSFVSPVLGVKIDNGNHMMLKANHNLLTFLEIINSSAKKELYPYFPSIKYFSFNIKGLWRLGVVSVLNTEYNKADKILYLKTILKSLRNPYPLFAANTLEDVFAKPFQTFANAQKIKIEYGKKCIGYEEGKLIFAASETESSAEDKVIWALPQQSLARIFNLPILPHNPISNIHFLLSPKERPFAFVGKINGAAEWFKIKGNILSATISAANNPDIFVIKEEAKEIFNLNNDDFIANSVICEKRATMSQDKETLIKRNRILKSLPKNIIIAGDWTQENLPCTMEAAITSGFKAAQEVL